MSDLLTPEGALSFPPGTRKIYPDLLTETADKSTFSKMERNVSSTLKNQTLALRQRFGLIEWPAFPMPSRALAFDIRLADITVFLAVRANRSVTSAARALGIGPSAVSKAIARIERQLGVRLLARSGRGVTLTNAAAQLGPLLEEASKALRKARRGLDGVRDLTVVAPSYVLAMFMPALASGMSSLRFRGLQMAGHVVLASAALRQFEVALLIGEHAKLPVSWQAIPIGVLEWGLFASPRLARTLGKPTLETLANVPFITPVSFHQGQWAAVDDGCPLAIDARTAGHETETAVIGMELAASTEQLIFGPRIAALGHLQSRRLKEVHVDGWNVKRSLTLAVDIDRISAPELSKMKAIALEMTRQASR